MIRCEQTECTVCTVQNVWWKKSESGVKRAKWQALRTEYVLWCHNPVPATGGLSDPCWDACGLSDPESSDPCLAAGVPCLAARWSSDPCRCWLVLALDCREEVLGVSYPWATSLMSISMIARLEDLLGCMMQELIRLADKKKWTRQSIKECYQIVR
jgi:hypothetical protein